MKETVRGGERIDMLVAAGKPLPEQTEKRGGSRGHPRLPFLSMRRPEGRTKFRPRDGFRAKPVIE